MFENQGLGDTPQANIMISVPRSTKYVDRDGKN